jgi:hypothetical protein
MQHTMKNDIAELKREIALLKERNKRVEADKAWETSMLRKVSVLITTYCVVALTLVVIGSDRPLVNALIPSLGYVLSTLTLGMLKNRFTKS